MKKSDLKTGMIVETRNKDMYLVMLNPDCENRELICFSGGFMPLYKYNDDLLKDSPMLDHDYDIVRIYTVGSSIANLFMKEGDLAFKTIWERKEPIKMTLAEVEEKLGYKIKIVGERE